MNRLLLPTVLAVVAAAALLVAAESAFAMSGQLHMSGAPGSAGSQGNLQVRVCAVSGKLTTATGQSFVLEKGEPVEVLDGKGAEIPPGAALPSDAPGSATAGIDLQQKEAKRIIKAAGDAKAVSKLLILKRREAALKVVKTVGLATAYTGTVTVPVRANKVHILVAAKKWQTFALTQEKMLNVKVTVTAAGKASVSIIDDAGTATPVASSGSGEGLTVRARMSGIIGDYAGRVAACVHPFTICKIVQEKFSDGLAKDKDLLRKWMCTIEHESGFVADTQQDTANKDKSCDVGLMQINSVNWFRTGECGGAKWRTSAKCKARMEELKQPSANLDEAKYLFTAAKNTLGPWYGFSKTDCKLKKSYLKPRYACPPTLAKYPATLAEWLETDPDNVL